MKIAVTGKGGVRKTNLTRKSFEYYLKEYFLRQFSAGFFGRRYCMHQNFNICKFVNLTVNRKRLIMGLFFSDKNSLFL